MISSLSDLSVLHLLLHSALTAAGLSLAYFFVRLYQVRTHVRKLSRKYDVKLMPHSFFWGHLQVLGECMADIPPDVYGSYLPGQLVKRFPELNEGLYYIDSWPFQDPMIAVLEPDMVAQFTVETSMPKAPGVADEFRPLTGATDILCLEGQEWKRWRTMFNPAFSLRNLSAMIPKIVKEGLALRDVLMNATASGDVFEMEHATSRFGMDVVGHIVLGHDLGTQKTPHPTMVALRRQIGLLGYGFWLKHYNPMTYIRGWQNHAMMDAEFIPMIKRYFSPLAEKESFKTIISLAQNWYTENAGKKDADKNVFRDLLPQLKILMIAGYETTGIALAFAYHHLAINPKVLEALRKEHDEVLGPVDQVADAMIANPSLVNQLPYTTGVIKESLRMHPPVSTIRDGSRTKFLVNGQGKKFPTEGFRLLSSTYDFQTTETVWHRGKEFLPERWVVRDERNPLYHGPHTKNSFRPFEMGPRACLGQELAMMDMRIALALTTREFDFTDAYPADAPKMDGSPCYNAQLDGELTAHCSLRCPVKISLRTA
ncbi:hypothetical protein MKZ38_001394 [Zalerion maritima]|uniref:Cytochrome P450 n=1 Tax=Zalerion maritima TaxID=339359 RepID=A0AAD5RRT7_9PEZI|nr:hypothetical protein MKZ38_001394 [Zalerion maritima]